MLAKFKYIPLLIFPSIFASCQTTNYELKTSESLVENDAEPILKEDTTVYIYFWQEAYDYKTSLVNNITLPNGYKRLMAKSTSFAAWLQHLPLNPDNTVYLYNGEKKYNQSAQFKVLNIDVGNQDLQQCADAVMRLRAEYLYASKQYDKIHFNYTNGVTIPYKKWSSGYYPSLKGNKVVWIESSNNKSYLSFKKYMTNIFMYAGTSSLEKEMKSIILSEIEPGDVLIKGGFPGHAVTVVDVCINEKTNDKAFIIAQSYMPAQSIHILNNLNNTELSPWYSISEINDVITTPEWTFYSNQLKRFKE